jgi:hypothetical protein
VPQRPLARKTLRPFKGDNGDHRQLSRWSESTCIDGLCADSIYDTQGKTFGGRRMNASLGPIFTIRRVLTFSIIKSFRFA